ncbi:hypothetical protein AcW1_000798 [Taiwanofungus camphoratus]|nr:hypothetical protein AcW2_000700 [Antrodia cinnamomea]KAI0961820.1 hypothetical protein AcV7_000818 [Antrodia cinnamomea]KAI0963831.1 hypothetical protein AcW1_000798 [Antrodia cinnamomea]
MLVYPSNNTRWSHKPSRPGLSFQSVLVCKLSVYLLNRTRSILRCLLPMVQVHYRPSFLHAIPSLRITTVTASPRPHPPEVHDLPEQPAAQRIILRECSCRRTHIKRPERCTPGFRLSPSPSNSPPEPTTLFCFTASLGFDFFGPSGKVLDWLHSLNLL